MDVEGCDCATTTYQGTNLWQRCSGAPSQMPGRFPLRPGREPGAGVYSMYARMYVSNHQDLNMHPETHIHTLTWISGSVDLESSISAAFISVGSWCMYVCVCVCVCVCAYVHIYIMVSNIPLALFLTYRHIDTYYHPYLRHILGGLHNGYQIANTFTEASSCLGWKSIVVCVRWGKERDARERNAYIEARVHQ